MCSRFVAETTEAIHEVFKVKLGLEKSAVFKPVIFPGYQAPVIVGGGEDDPRLESRFWGFITRIPGKRDPKKILEKIMQNAVSETIDEKRTFMKSWNEGRRCIIPVKNFMEPLGGKFVPINDPNVPILALAGIWDVVTYKGEKKEAFTMLTCRPNSVVAKFHDRMPVVLNYEDVETWLSPDTTPEEAKELCQPYSGKLKVGVD